jgi:EpsI family protein
MNNKSFIIVVVILVAASVIGFVSYLPTRTDSALRIKVDAFPKAIGEWTGTDIALSERDYEILETRNLFVREYKNLQGDSVYLYLIYSEDNRKVSHPPEVCLLGGGLTIVDKKPVQITNSIKATKLLVEKANSRQVMVYWYKAGDFNTDTYLSQQLKIVLGRMLGKRTPGAMIRVFTDIKDNNEARATDLIKSFTAQIEPLLAKYTP